jgi:hypothetical protein
MNPSDLQFTFVPLDDWNQELAVQIWEVEGGKVFPPDEESTVPPVASSNVNVPPVLNQPTP